MLIDRKALLSAYQAQSQALLNLATRVLGCRSRAEDVLQDAFLKLWEGSLNLSMVQAPERYLNRLVRNLAIDHLRRLQLEQRYGAAGELAELQPSEISPEQVVGGQQALRQLLAALAELTPRMRRVFTLSQLDGLTQREVATTLGASPALINLILRDTLGHCRVRLDGQCRRACPLAKRS
ncbi:sigma-70 family RNA polymerase sigma factor [Pseudomonas sp. NPDC077186]|uniref:sigma-70 family RNA polymerase sigma factor n=1 Tax=Pseudomonas sp. NPDC077186 TaxID=3364421 RepID=UPI0037C6C46C